jgi:hypothetical protein
VRALLRLPQTAIVHQAPERFLRVRLLAAALGVALDDETLIFYDIRDLMSVPLRLQRALPRRAGRSGVG